MSRTVLVTGCSSGIGRATAERFRDEGLTVYATARDPDDISDLRARGCRTARLDVRDHSEVQRVVDRVYDEAGSLDCLVNNAGYGQFGAVEDVPMAKVRRQFETNTFGPLALIQAIVPRMREQGRGTVVNVGAGVGGVSPAGLGVYTASKYALHSLSDALRQELSGHGVDVVVVEPGFVDTGFTRRVLAELDAVDRSVAHARLYRVLDDVDAVSGSDPGINRPERVADAIYRVAAAENPSPVVRVGAVAGLGTALAAVVRGRLRDAAARVAVRLLATDHVQRFLERRGDRSAGRANGDSRDRRRPDRA